MKIRLRLFELDKHKASGMNAGRFAFILSFLGYEQVAPVGR